MTYTIYVIALTITFIGLLVNLVCCFKDAQEFRKLSKRVKALEDKQK